MNASSGLTVAVTGPTGTFGFGLIPLLEADDRIDRVIGIARRSFDPLEHGWTKMVYRQGDVRDVAALEESFRGVDVVVHLAFLITGTASRETTRSINIDGTINAFRAAAAAGVRRFVYASSAAAYGFHDDNPIGLDETWPTRPDTRLFYAEEKAELEALLALESAAHPKVALYLLRPPIVLGPHAAGAKDLLPKMLAPLLRGVVGAVGRLPGRLPTFVPAIPMQFIHEQDVGRALLLCIVAAGPAGAYNISGDGIVTAQDVARQFGLMPLPFPLGATQRVARLIAALPTPAFAPPVTEWFEAVSHPIIMDTTKATRDLGWQPEYSSLEALRAMFH